MKPLFVIAACVAVAAVAYGTVLDGDCPGKGPGELEEGSDLAMLYQCVCDMIDADPPCFPPGVVNTLKAVKAAGKLKVDTGQGVVCAFAEARVAGLREWNKNNPDLPHDIEKALAQAKKEEAAKGGWEGCAGADCITIILQPTLKNTWRKKAVIFHEAVHVMQHKQENWVDPATTKDAGSGGGGGGATLPPAATPGWSDYRELGAEIATLKWLLDQAKKNEASSDPDKEAKAKEIKEAIEASQGVLTFFISNMCDFLTDNPTSPQKATYEGCKKDAQAAVKEAAKWLEDHAETGEKVKPGSGK